MTESEVYEMLESTGFPVAYRSFKEGEAPDLPYLVYYYPRTHDFKADDTVYLRVNVLNIELYTGQKDLESERVLEDVLSENGFICEKSEGYLESEEMYEVLYETEVRING